MKSFLVDIGFKAFIFFGFTIIWTILGSVNENRTYTHTDFSLKKIQNTYGGPLRITPPRIYYELTQERQGKVGKFDTVSTYKERETVDPSGSDIKLDLSLERKKVGNLWFPIFKATYRGSYEYKIDSIPVEYRSEPLFLLPGLKSSESILRSIELKINGSTVEPLSKLVSNTPIELTSTLKADGNLLVDFYYETTGTAYLLYALSNNKDNKPDSKKVTSKSIIIKDRLTRLDNFSLKLTTDFLKYDFPRRTIPYTKILKTENKTEFEWKFDKTVTGKNIGIIVPKETNPGEIASRISFFAPIPLLFFFVVMTIFGILTKQQLHPMHFFFLAATFLSFHLIYSYSADHISMYAAFTIATLVSCFLTFSYLIRVRDRKYSFIAMLFQLLYLVMFSWSFFYKTDNDLGITGLIVTIVSVLTLFVLMQLTANLNWKNLNELD